LRVNATTLVGRVEVVADEDGLTSRAGTALLAGVADRTGLTGALGEAMGGVRERASRHCPGRALRDVAVMLADGGDALCDVRVLRDEPALFGAVASDATAWRAIAAVDAGRLDAIRRARAVARERVWARIGAPRRVVLDIDATLVSAHSDKQGAAGTYKGGYGFNPLVCFESETGRGDERALAARQRRLEQRLGSRRGALPRTRAAARRDRQEVGACALRLGRRHASAVRHRRIARLEQLHRQRARVEDAIRCAKDSGLRNLPFRAFAPNQVWLELVLMSQDLIRWTQRLLLADTPARRWEPKRLRYRLLHVAARITRHARRTRLHLPSGWPWRHDLIGAWHQLGALPTS
jgi:hypothetical protein